MFKNKKKSKKQKPTILHVEIKNTTVNDWVCVPQYKEALEQNLGGNALEKFDQAAKENMVNLNHYSETIYENFKKICH